MEGKVVIVTGGNTGIGYETAKGLAKKGAHVIITSRNLEKGQQAVDKLKKETSNQKVEFLQLDNSDFKSVRNFAQKFIEKKLPLHVLVNNAGIASAPYARTVDGNENTLQTNHLAPFLLTLLLLKTLKNSAPSRIVNVSSSVHYFATPLDLKELVEVKNYDPFGVYSTTKLLNIHFTIALQRRLEKEGIHNVYVNALHPGLVQTEIVTQNDPTWSIHEFGTKLNIPVLTPEEGAIASIHVASDPSIEKDNIKAKYYDANNLIIKEVSDQAKDEQLQEKVWELSSKLTQINY